MSNPNKQVVTFTWLVPDTGQKGSGFVLGAVHGQPNITYFQTSTQQYATTVELLVNGAVQDVQTAYPSPCDAATVTPAPAIPTPPQAPTYVPPSAKNDPAIQMVAFFLDHDVKAHPNMPAQSGATATTTPAPSPTPTVSGSSPDTTITYHYDNLYRVLNARYYNGILTPTLPTNASDCSNPSSDPTMVRCYSYAYDLAGNRTGARTFDGVNNSNTTYLYNLANQLVSSTKDNNSPRSYSYDANGNMTSDGINTYGYNAANRLTSYTAGASGPVTNYLYDGQGHRVSQTTGGNTTTYLYDQTAGVPQLLGQTAYGVPTYYLVGAGSAIGQQQNQTWSYFGYDGLGSVRQLTDTAGTLRYSANYDPYGTPFYQAGDISTSLGFAGQVTDANGLQFLNARYYSPTMGAFLTSDPSFGDLANVLSQNGYNYADNDPVNLSDPTGMDASSCGYTSTDLSNCYVPSTYLPPWQNGLHAQWLKNGYIREYLKNYISESIAYQMVADFNQTPDTTNGAPIAKLKARYWELIARALMAQKLQDITGASTYSKEWWDSTSTDLMAQDPRDAQRVEMTR